MAINKKFVKIGIRHKRFSHPGDCVLITGSGSSATAALLYYTGDYKKTIGNVSDINFYCEPIAGISPIISDFVEEGSVLDG